MVACEGTYAEDVVVSRPLTLLGRAPVIQAVATTSSTCLFALDSTSGNGVVRRKEP